MRALRICKNSCRHDLGTCCAQYRITAWARNNLGTNLIRQVKRKKRKQGAKNSIQSRGGSYTRSSQDAAGMSKHELGTAVQKLHSDPLLVDRKRAHHDTEHQSSCVMGHLDGCEVLFASPLGVGLHWLVTGRASIRQGRPRPGYPGRTAMPEEI
jgi:hypothetical protein